MRKTLAIPAGLLAAAALMFAPALASADTASTLTVVGTSDVSDSGLIPNLLQPQFQQQFPGFAFKYVGSATGAAIQSAENGTGGPSALIVHASSLENQFVAGGFSLNNQFGNAIWTNDFVFAGSTADPGGVAANAPNNIAQAFADVATAGQAGTAAFYSRGGTNTASGTTVEEHALWALMGSAGLTPAGVVICTVSAADGGGATPIKSSVQATSGQPCPDSGSVAQANAPTWYHINGGNQAANVVATNACTAGGGNGNNCYSLTDRGTYDFLASGTDPAGTVPNLKIVTRNNSASAPGGANELINYFHIYIINPNQPGETVNQTAAQDFVNFLTSTTVQGELKNYLANTGDPAGPPFVADASPHLTVSGLPKTYHAGKALAVSGQVTNAQPGFPAPSGATVTLSQIVAGVPVTVATAKTNASGNYSIRFSPTSTGSYAISTGPISQIEIPTLSPPYGDILSPAASTPVPVAVQSKVSGLAVKSVGGRALVVGSVAPGKGHAKATVAFLARKAGSHGGFRKVTVDHLGASDGNFAASLPLAVNKKGWQVKVTFADGKQVLGSTSQTKKVTVQPKPHASAKLSSVKVSNGNLAVRGSVFPKPTSGAKVELLALNTAAGSPDRFRVFKTINVGRGKKQFTLHAKLKRGTRWVLELKYIQKGQASGFSMLRTIAVN
ncbi:MAG TPA: substrate-binding domain-containing protein [Solirubrobacteraceae bacterium]